jgi:hypothetical protein
MAQNIGKHGLQILLLVDLCGKILPPFDNSIPLAPFALPGQKWVTRRTWHSE